MFPLYVVAISVNECASMYTLLSAYIYGQGKIMKTVTELVLLSYLFAINVLISTGCPHVAEDAKAAYKSGEIVDLSPPITLETIKRKLKETGIFNIETVILNKREKKELSKLFDAIEIMTTSRNRQPSSVQNMFSSLRLVERAVKKLLKEGQISDSLAAKFDWNKLNVNSSGQRRDKPQYYLDKTTNMRVFNTK